MSNEDEFFAEMHPQIAQVIGIAVMQLLVEKRAIKRGADRDDSGVVAGAG
jgi:hypothetical protein